MYVHVQQGDPVVGGRRGVTREGLVIGTPVSISNDWNIQGKHQQNRTSFLRPLSLPSQIYLLPLSVLVSSSEITGLYNSLMSESVKTLASVLAYFRISKD